MNIEASQKYLTTAEGIIGGFIGFIVISAVQALYGPAMPLLRSEFGVSSGEAGL